jgi:hypothetical protein
LCDSSSFGGGGEQGGNGWQRSAKYAFYEAIGNPKTFVAPMVEHR